MTSSGRILTAFALLAVVPGSALAQTGKYQVTPEEHAACDNDAYRLCSDASDEDEVLNCMRAHRSELTPMCRTVFIRGLKRRHIKM